MDLTNLISGTCWRCTEKELGPDYKEKNRKCTRIFELKRGMVTTPSPTGTRIREVVDALCCRECGMLVPLECWRSYQATGDITMKVMWKKGGR